MSEKVRCSRCGKRINRKRAVERKEPDTYLCRNCTEKEERKNTWFYQNSPLVLGVLFLIGGLGAIGRGDAYLFRFRFDEFTTATVCLVLGAVMLVWFLYQKIKMKKEE